MARRIVQERRMQVRKDKEDIAIVGVTLRVFSFFLIIIFIQVYNSNTVVCSPIAHLFR